MKALLREERNGRVALLTRNLVPGKRVYNEELIQRDRVEYRTWDPFRSKLAAAILKGMPEDVIKEGDKVLYLGRQRAPPLPTFRTSLGPAVSSSGSSSRLGSPGSL